MDEGRDQPSGRPRDHTGPADDPRVAVAVPEDRSTRATRAISNVTASAGSFPAILVAVALVVLWCVGAAFVPGGLGNTGYQLVVSTVSSIVTFIMVFVIQSSQNRDNRAMQAKLDAQSDVLTHMARALGVEEHRFLLTRLVGLEDAPEDEIEGEQQLVRRAAARTAQGQAGDQVVSGEV